MLAALIALGGALVYGVGDFMGGAASRRIPPQLVVAISATTGTLILIVATAILRPPFSGAAVGWGVASGFSNAAGILLLYVALAIGPMSVLSPITAVLAALVPVGVGLVDGERLSVAQSIGALLALVAVVLVGLVRGAGGTRVTARGVAIAVVSGVLLGTSLTAFDRAPHDSGTVPILFNRAVSALVLIVIVLITLVLRRRGARVRPDRATLLLAVACGVVDLTANTLVVSALRVGELGVTGAINALYPVSTVVLAAILLRERLTPVQALGSVAAIVAAVLLALG